MVTFQLESLDTFLSSTYNILNEIWESDWKDSDSPLIINHDKFIELEKNGVLKIIIGRDETKDLVTFWGGLLAPSLFTAGKLVCYGNFYWMSKAYNGFTFIRLMKFVDNYLVEQKVQQSYLEAKLTNKAQKLLEKVGYKPTGTIMTKVYEY